MTPLKEVIKGRNCPMEGQRGKDLGLYVPFLSTVRIALHEEVKEQRKDLNI